MAFLNRLILPVAVLLLTGAQAQAQNDDAVQLQEQEIKAGLLYNFLKYIEWPPASAAASSPTVVVCLFGPDPFDGYLQPMAGRTVNQRPIAIRNIHDAQDAAGCQLLFINAEEKERWPQLFKLLAGKGVLTVSDFAAFTDAGGMVEFTLKDNRIGVQLNMDSVAAAQLRVEDRLLKLVTVVHSGGR